MKRACYYKTNDGYKIYHVRSTMKNGQVITEDIKELKDSSYSNLLDLFIDANSRGYGIVGSVEDVKNATYQNFYRRKCGDYQLDINDL